MTIATFAGFRLLPKGTAREAAPVIVPLAVCAIAGVTPFVKKNARIADHTLVLPAVCVGLIGAVPLKSWNDSLSCALFWIEVKPVGVTPAGVTIAVSELDANKAHSPAVDGAPVIETTAGLMMVLASPAVTGVPSREGTAPPPAPLKLSVTEE